MLFRLSILAALGCAICNGVSAVLQKVGADSHPHATSLHPGLVWKLLRNKPYVYGLLIDLVAWILTLIAVHNLPLFLVQPITSVSVIITVLVERLFFKRPLRLLTLAAIGVILLGLLIIASQAMLQTARRVSGVDYWMLVAGIPFVVTALGTVFVRLHDSFATTVLAGLSGVAFGGTAVTGRMLSFTETPWHAIYSPIFISLVIYGLIGIMLFTVALQRQHASTVNAAMITFETIVPMAIGLIVLGDTPKSGSYAVIIIGMIVALSGTLAVLVLQPEEALKT